MNDHIKPKMTPGERPGVYVGVTTAGSTTGRQVMVISTWPLGHAATILSIDDARKFAADILVVTAAVEQK